MKSLCLIRHAKSDWSDHEMCDHDRPLAPRGVRATGLIGARLRDTGIVPDLIVSSTALRACETARGIARTWTPAPPVRTRRDIYLAEPATLLAVLRTIDDGVGTVALVGHEPGIRLFGLALSGARPAPFAHKYPTGAVAVFSIAADRWREVGRGSGRLVAYILPRALESGTA